MAGWKSRARTAGRGVAVLGAVMALGACELVLQEAPPQAGASCAAWRGGCKPVVNVAEGPVGEPLRAERQLPGNLAQARTGVFEPCDTAPWICQLSQGAQVVDQRYLNQ